MTATGRWAAPSTSRITPPTPVLAPPNGSTADGWLCVSALRATVVPSTKATMPALPTNADRTNGAATRSVASRSRSRSPGRRSPVVVVISARNVLWAQCSLHVWARVSSSTSVGSRPAARKWSRITCSSAGSSASARSRPTASSPSSSRLRSSTTVAVARGSEPGCRSGSAKPVHHSSITGLATRRRSRSSAVAGSVPGGSSTRRPVAAAATGTPSWPAACTNAAAAVSVTPGCSVISMPSVSGRAQLPTWSSGIGEEVGRVGLDRHRRGRPRGTPGQRRAPDRPTSGRASTRRPRWPPPEGPRRSSAP